MKNKTLQMQVASPCSQDWAEMTPQGAGRHCLQCERVVIDFTEMTDAELLRLFRQHERKLCGRFREDQLNREIPIPPPPPQNSYRAMGALLSGLLLAGGVSAQTGTTSPKTELVLATSVTPQSLLSGKTPIRIEGQVTDVKGNPIEFATVFLSKNNAHNSAYYDTGAVTEPDGFFSIELTDMDSVKLDISCLGYENQTLQLNLQKDRALAENLKIALKPSHYQLQEVVVVAYESDPRRHITGLVCTISRETGTKRVPVKKKKEEPIINVYPNPFVNHCQVDMIVPATDAYLFCVYNGYEQLLYSEAFELASGRVNVGFSLPDGLPAASYWLRITRGAELICTRQLIKQ